MIFYLALRNINRNRRRTLAILLTVAMGSGSLFIFRGFNFGIMNQYKENTIHSRYGHGQINLKGYREQVFEKPWDHWISDVPEMAKRLKSEGGAKYVFPRVEFFGLLTNGQITVSGRGQGIDGSEEAKFFNTLNIVEGVTLSDQPDGILLGKGLAKALNVKVGDTITVLGSTINGSMNGADLHVVGVFHTGSKEFDDAVFRVPMAQANQLLDSSKAESISIGLRSAEDWQRFALYIEQNWPALEAVSFAVLDKVYYQHSVDWLKSQFNVIQLIIVSIVVLGIFNAVSTGILERKQEIGNLRANGESSFNVFKLLVYEGAILGVVGGAMGIVLSFLLERLFLREGITMPPAPGLTRQFRVIIEFTFSMGIAAFIMSCFTAVIASLLAATKVVRISIADALRSL